MHPARLIAACSLAAGGLLAAAVPVLADSDAGPPSIDLEAVPDALDPTVVEPSGQSLEPGQVAAPSLTYVAAPGQPTLLDALPTRSVGARAVAGPATGAIVAGVGFAAPPNTDFQLQFTPAVDSASRAAVAAAAGVWSEVLDVRVPIQVLVDLPTMPHGVLGAAGPTSAFYGKAEFPRSDVLYPVAQANQLAGRDLDPDAPDIELALSSAVAWDKRLDGSVDPWSQSMLSVAVHELGHGLGHTTWTRDSGSGLVMNYVIGGRTMALAYDTFVGNAAGTSLTSMSTTALQGALRDWTFWGGPRGIAASNGYRPALYTPAVWEPGSSVGHLDEGTFGVHVMSPYLNRGEFHGSIPPLTVAMLADTGWPMANAPTAADRTAAEAYVRALSVDFLDRSASAGEVSRWSDVLLAGGSRSTVTSAYAGSDEWIGALVDDLYQTTLGRLPDPAGRTNWINVLRGGTPAAEVAARFYASDEYFNRVGGTNGDWVRAMYQAVLHRSPDPTGFASWVDALARGTGRTTVARGFMWSVESRTDRVVALYQALLGRGPDPTGLATWTRRLLDGHDVNLASTLATSQEYFNRAGARFG